MLGLTCATLFHLHGDPHIQAWSPHIQACPLQPSLHEAALGASITEYNHANSRTAPSICTSCCSAARLPLRNKQLNSSSTNAPKAVPTSAFAWTIPSVPGHCGHDPFFLLLLQVSAHLSPPQRGPSSPAPPPLQVSSTPIHCLLEPLFYFHYGTSCHLEAACPLRGVSSVKGRDHVGLARLCIPSTQSGAYTGKVLVLFLWNE